MLANGWVSCARAAERLQVHVVTVHRLIYDGKIKTKDVRKLGRSKYIRIAALVESQTPAVRELYALSDWDAEEAEAKELLKGS